MAGGALALHLVMHGSGDYEKTPQGLAGGSK